MPTRCLKVYVSGSWLIIENACKEHIHVRVLTLYYKLRSLAYDRREVSSEPRRVEERIMVDHELPPTGSLRVKLRDVEVVEKVCIEGKTVECYQPAAVDKPSGEPE